MVLIRHGQSTWNQKNLFTGWANIGLTEQGIDEAKKGGEAFKGFHFDIAYSSVLARAVKTLEIFLKSSDHPELPWIKDWALNERDYGELTGLNKAETAAKYGDEQVHIWRRSFDVPPPGGESLEMTVKRSWPYFEKEILPLLKEGKKVIISAHGNSLRAIVKNLEGLSDQEIPSLEIPHVEPWCYLF